jgi:hypothetical protein
MLADAGADEPGDDVVSDAVAAVGGRLDDLSRGRMVRAGLDDGTSEGDECQAKVSIDGPCVPLRSSWLGT